MLDDARSLRWRRLGCVRGAALAVTSNDAWVRRLRQGWKMAPSRRLSGGGLTFAHWALSAFDTTADWCTWACSPPSRSHTPLLPALEHAAVEPVPQ